MCGEFVEMERLQSLEGCVNGLNASHAIEPFTGRIL